MAETVKMRRGHKEGEQVDSVRRGLGKRAHNLKMAHPSFTRCDRVSAAASLFAFDRITFHVKMHGAVSIIVWHRKTATRKKIHLVSFFPLTSSR